MPLNVPNTIVNGEPNDAAPVQENFETIENYVNTEVIQRDGSVAFQPAALATILPPGMMVDYGGSAAPSGWLLCDGTAVSRATYSALFAALGTAYGAGDGSTTFNLPNLKGRVAAGRDAAVTAFDTLGETGGSRDAIVVTHTHTQPTHVHSFSDTATTTSAGAHVHDIEGNVDSAGSGAAVVFLNIFNGASPDSGLISSEGAHTHDVTVSGNTGAGGGDTTGSTGSSGTNANLPPYQVVNKIIKT